MYQIEEIGKFFAKYEDKYLVPSQPKNYISNWGVIKLNPKHNFEQALEGLEGFDRIWILFRFHKNASWKPKVLPPRGGKKQGVFATRSPHRPNFIGMSNVKLEKIDKLTIYISNHDLLDGTPILDIKPYINTCDHILSKSQGWLESIEEASEYEIEWSEYSKKQILFLKIEFNLDLKNEIILRLKKNPYPYPNNRVTRQETGFRMRHKTWIIDYQIEEEIIKIDQIMSGYDQETLLGKKESRWNDVHIHQALFQDFFPL